MKRKIIEIDQQKCNGCGLCANSCPEGAIQIVDGKAQVVGEFLCDGLGACIGNCPVDAIKITEREAESYDEYKVMENLLGKGKNVILAHLKHLLEHGQMTWFNQATKFIDEKKIDIDYEKLLEKEDKDNFCGCHHESIEINAKEIDTALSNWPIQLHLINPIAPYFKGADLLIAADCTAFSFGNFHSRFLSGKKLIIACPKLDVGKEIYLDKLVNLISNMEIKSLTVVIMQVPCCMGLLNLVKEAREIAIKKIDINFIVLSTDGDIITEKVL